MIEQDAIQQHPANPDHPVKNSARTVAIKIYEEPKIPVLFRYT